MATFGRRLRPEVATPAKGVGSSSRGRFRGGRVQIRAALLVLLILAFVGPRSLCSAAPPPAADILSPPQYLGTSAGLPVRKSVSTFKELKERRVVKQKYDFSCGAAALATVLAEYYKLPVTEEGIVAYIIHKRGEEEAVRRYKEKKGFSLLDLKLAAASIRFRASAYSEMTLAELAELNAPVIVPIRTRNYDHFVVFRGVESDRVYLTDPVVGLLTMKVSVFRSVWRDGIGMVLKSPQGFQPTDWQPDKQAHGFYVSRDQVRAIISAGRGLTGRRGAREF